MGKKSKPPPAPDYAALDAQRAALAKTAAEEQTVTNRPDQYTPFGSSEWVKGDDGGWSQYINLSPEEQQALDQERQFNLQQQGIASGLLGKAGETLGTPMDLSGLPELQGFDPSQLRDFGSIDPSQLPELQDLNLSGMDQLDPGFGAVQEVRDAMMGRMAPARSQLRDNEIQRLKSQGLSENSEAFQRGMARLGQGDTDAEQQALLASMGAYGDIFNRGLAKNEQQLRAQSAASALRGSNRGQLFGEQGAMAGLNNATRGQQFGEQDASARLAGILRQQSLGEQQMIRQSPLDDFMKLTGGINPSMPQMPNFMGGTGYDAANPYGAAKDQYSAAMDAYNAKQAQKGGLMKGLFGLGGAALGSPWVGTALGF